MTLYVLFGLIVAGLIGLNIFATWHLVKADNLERSQKYVQAVLIWCVPLLCAVLVIGVTNRGVDKPSGKYRDRDAEGVEEWPRFDASGDAGPSSD